MILVTAATGQVGSAALNALVARGVEARALVRDPSKFVAPAGVEVVHGDFDDEASIAKSLEGVTVMLLAGRDSPRSPAQHKRVLALAVQAEVRHVVKLSAVGASPDSPIGLMREHHEVDEEVRKAPVGWTILKPHLFMQNLLRAADSIRRDRRLSAPMGSTRLPLVDTRDVGELAAVVLSNFGPHAGKEYSLTGPDAVNYNEVAATLTAAAGHEITYEAVGADEFETQLRAAGIPDWRAYDLAHIASAYRAVDNVVSPDLPKLLGRRANSLTQFLEDHRTAAIGPAH